MEFCIEYKKKKKNNNSISTIIMILHIPIRLNTRKMK